jgi:hypothetical protein
MNMRKIFRTGALLLVLAAPALAGDINQPPLEPAQPTTAVQQIVAFVTALFS